MVFGGAHIPVADEAAILIIVPGREGENGLAQAHQALGLAGKQDGAAFIIAVVEGPDADGVSGRHQALTVIKNQGKFRVQLPEHANSFFFKKGQQNLTVGAALKAIALLNQLLLQLSEAVNFAVAHQGLVPPEEGLHAVFVEPHNGQPVKPQKSGTVPQGHIAGLVRPPGKASVKIGLNLLLGKLFSDIANDGTHGSSSFMNFFLRGRRDWNWSRAPEREQAK